MTQKPDLATLMVMIDQGWPYNADRYRDLAYVDADTFTVKHSLLHMMKSQGVIAAQVEGADHGNEMDYSELKLAVLKELVNVLKLACMLGITVPDIERHVVDQFGTK